jgi:hypothetical protein
MAGSETGGKNGSATQRLSSEVEAASEKTDRFAAHLCTDVWTLELVRSTVGHES